MPTRLPTNGNPIWRDVDKDLIADFLGDFETHPLNYRLQGGQLAAFLRGTRESRLQLWDVVLPNGSVDSPIMLGDVVKPSVRRVVLRPENNSILVPEAARALVLGSNVRVSPSGIRIGAA